MTDSPTPFLNNRSYDVLKWLAQIFFPALGALYFALSQTWGTPYGVEVVGSIAAFDTFLGLLLGLSTRSYVQSGAKYDGVIDVVNSSNTKTFSLNLNTHPDALENKKDVTFKVNPTTEGT